MAIFPLGLGLDGGRHRDQATAARTASSLAAGRRGGACRLRDAGSEARPRWAPGSAGKGGLRWTGEKGSDEPRKPQEKRGQRRPRTRSCRPKSHRDADERTGSLRPQGLRGNRVRSVSRTDWQTGGEGAERGENRSCDWWKDIPVSTSVLRGQRRTHILSSHWLTCLGGGAN